MDQDGASKHDTDTAQDTFSKARTKSDDEEAAWSSQGYTPLQDMNLKFSMTSDDNDDEQPPAVLFSQGNSTGGAAVFASHPGAFFADMSADSVHDINPGGEDDDWAEVSRHVEHESKNVGESSVENFHSVADQALQALEADYLSTLQSESTAREPEAELDGAPIDDTRSNNLMDSFFKGFDINQAEQHEEPTSKATRPSVVPSHSESHPTDTMTHKDVDVEAVRRAVQAIQLRDPLLTNGLEDWEMAQKEAAASVPRQHCLIPSAPLSAFRKQTAKAVQATANLSRSATIAEALRRLNLLRQQDVLRIHVIGCDHVECDRQERIRTLFGPIVRWIGANAHSPGCLELMLIGPGIPASAMEQSPVNLLPNTSSSSGLQGTHVASGRKSLKQAQVSCYNAVYDEWLLTQSDDCTADVVVAFNAGIWGYKEWRKTIEQMIQRANDTPFVVTAYTLYEAEDDFEVIQQVSSKSKELTPARCLWEPEINPYSSKVDRLTLSAVPGRRYRENYAWQAWCF